MRKLLAVAVILCCSAVHGASLNDLPLSPSASTVENLQPGPTPPSYDAHGGLTTVSCTNSTGQFITVKISARWWSCTPEGHGYFFQGIGAWNPPPNQAKYSANACTAAQDLISEAQGWNFNGVGELGSYDAIKPIGACSASITKMPMVETIELSLYATAGPFSKHQNFTGYVNEPTKNLVFGNDSNSLLNYRGAGLTDDFANVYVLFANQLTLHDPFLQTFKASSYSFALYMDDTDFKLGFGSTAAFDSITPGHNKPNLAYVVATTSPVQTYNNFTYSNTPVYYLDVNVYSKNLMVSAPANCVDATHPIDGTHGTCSWATWVLKKYSTIAAANAAWGSTYTGLGSDGKCHGFTSTSFCGSGSGSSAEIIGTGNGSATVFSHTLADGVVSQNSVQLYFNGNAFTGDCPGCAVNAGQGSFNNVANTGPFQPTTSYLVGDQFLDANGYIETVTTGGISGGTFSPSSTAFHASTTSGSAVMENDGPAVLAGAQPWLQGGQITVNDDAADGFQPASFFLQTVWHGATSVPSRLVGNTFPTGNPRLTVLAQNNANDIPAGATGVDIYVACRMLSGPASKGCVAAGSPDPAPTLQMTNVPYPAGTWQEPTTGLVNGAALPAPQSFINYSTKQVQVTTTAPLQPGVALAASYISDGYGIGNQLMDEDGRHTAWMGHESVCLQPVNGGGPGTTSWACRQISPCPPPFSVGTCNPGGYPAPDMNPVLANDLSLWQTQYATQYFSTVRNAMKQPAAEPNLLYFGCDTCGDWFGPPRLEILQGMAPYTDGIFTTVLGSASDAAARYSFLTQYFGDKPVMFFSTLEANPDSAMAASTSGGVYQNSTQPSRANDWLAMVNMLLNTTSFNGTFQGVGIVYWGMYDFPNEGFNWGLKSVTDNAYDAHEAALTPTTVPCSVPLAAFTCGNQPPVTGATPPFGDLFGGTNGVTNTNLLWTTGSAPTNVLTVQSATPNSGVPIGNSPADNGAHTSVVTPGTLTFNTGTPVVLTAPATAPGGNAFASWTCPGGVVSGLTCSLTLNADTTAIANYAATTNTLTVNSSPSGITITNSPADNGGHTSGVTSFVLTFTTGTVVTLTAPPTSGLNSFSSWTCTGGTASGQTCTVTVSSNISVTANYTTPPPTVTVTANSASPSSGVLIQASPADNNGKTSGNTSFVFTYNSGTALVFTAPATAGANTFSNWTCPGGTVSGLTCSVSPTTNVTITANYVAPSNFALTVNSSPSGIVIAATPADNGGHTSGTTSFSLSYPSGTLVTLTAPPNSGARAFANWTGCGSTTGASCNITMTGNLSVTANYAGLPIPTNLKVSSGLLLLLQP